MKRIVCIITTVMMLAAMMPYAVFAAAGDVIEGDTGVEDSIFDKDDEPTEPEKPGDDDGAGDVCKHQWGDWKIKKDSTCEEIGEKERTCALCKEIEKDVVGLKDHTVVIDKAVEATCTTTGLTEGSHCSVCGEVLVKQEETSLSHEYKQIGVKKASLTEDGEYTLECELCGAPRSDVIPRIETVELLFPRVNYDGKVKTPEVVAVDAAGNVIDAANYTVDYPKNIKKIGAYKVNVSFIGDIYEGSETLTFAVVRPAPKTAKIQLSTAKGGYDDVVYSWSKVSYAKGYRIYYKKASSSKYTLYKTTNSNKTTKITKKNLSDGVKYNFKVVSYVVIDGKKYESANAKVFSIYTLKKLPTPKVTKSGSKVKVAWTNINGDTGYQISKATKKSGTKIVATYKTTKGTYKKLTAKKGTKYYYKVRVYKTYKVGKKYVKVYGPWSGVTKYTKK